MRILGDNKIKCVQVLPDLEMKDLKLPAQCPGGYVAVLKRLLKKAKPPQPDAPAREQGEWTGLEGLEHASKKGFHEVAKSLGASLAEHLNKGKTEVVYPDLEKALDAEQTTLYELFPESVWPQTNAVAELATTLKKRKKAGLVNQYVAAEMKKFLPAEYVSSRVRHKFKK